MVDSTFTSYEPFTLGGTGGDSYNVSSGLTGTLITGHLYQLSGIAYTQAYPDADLGASAFGNITMTIGVAAIRQVP